MQSRDRLMRALVISCVLEGLILCGLALGFLGSGWWSGLGVALALLSLASLALLAHLVTTKRW